MKIGEFSRKTGLSVYTIRFYEKIGLIPAPPRDASGHRVYSQDSLGWVNFLEQLNATGMKQADRVFYAKLRQQGDSTLTQRRWILEAHYKKICADLERLQRTSQLMQRKISHYRELEAKQERKDDGCSGERP
ncbi:MAG: MerR family transcriptional regulator [Rhodobacterales bacterium]|nr:MAG: MerR family transcriptional regulator [Rhodobacterales bacterium]